MTLRTILIIVSIFIALLFFLATTLLSSYSALQGKATVACIVMAFLAGGMLCCVLLLFVRGTILPRLQYMLGFERGIAQRKITEETDHMYLEQIRQLNDELSRKLIDLAAANNELETFNYSVSHDMRGPLTRISGYCQLLLDDHSDLDPVARKYIARIHESGSWLNEMVDALLHLAQVTRVEIISININLSEIAESALKEMSLESPDRSVRTCIEPDIVVAGDSRLLKMVMLNLLSNAWKYSSCKSNALIEFGALQTESGPVYYVRDNGAGFDMKDADKLFRAFSRLHDSSQFNGTGIGLATVQRIIFRHGGKIWAEAAQGVGATFFFTLQKPLSI
jgi:light-regulated signal transduction histidine kinase (bacteriophytochrome)